MYSKSASALSLTYTNTTRGSESSINNNNNNKQTVPDLSHLSEAERKIISSVLERQRAEEEQCNDLLSSHTSFKTTTTTSTATSNSFNRNVFIRNLEESEFDQIKTVASPSQITTASSKNTNTQQIKYSTLPHTTASHLKKQEQEELKSSNLHQCHSISDIANETKQRYGSIDTGNSCDLCKKTKFTSSGAGHICFHCKLRCCVRCAFKYQSKNKQIWTCVECKKKQDTLLRSGKWFSESTNLNKKNFTSDYILNKGVNLNTNIRENSKNSSILNTDTTGRPDVIQQSTSNIMSSNTIDTNSAIKPPSRRVLPTITKQKSVQLKSAKDNEDDDYDDLSKRQILTRNAQINSNSNETNTITTNSARSSINDNSNSSKRSLRQPLIKQISLNNPPTYLNRSTANNNNNNQDDEFSLYNSSNNNPSLVKQTFTSNQDLGNTLLLSNNLNEQSNSSQNSSINNINRRSSANRERLQDPQQMLKAFKSSNPNSRLNSITNLSSLQQQQAQEDDLYQTRHVNETILEQVSSKLVTDTNTNITTNKPAMRRLLPTSNPVQRAKQLLMQPTDSLSSDPSDYQQTRQIEFKSNLEEMSRKQSKNKRNTRSRKQPSIPVNAASGSVSTTAAISTTIPTTTSTISNLPTQQQLIQKTLMKHNLKQHSLTSSDDDLINMASQGNKRNKNDFSMPDPEEEEDNFNDDDVDEEIRSTTEISTNDEMDLESGSVSINNINKNRVNIINSNKNNATINIKPVRNLSSLTTSNLITHQSKTIDDYLVQNLKKEEILAAKMSKFLSPTNWQLSSDANFSSTSTVDSSVEFNTSSSLGLKIVGGRANPLEPTQLCAYVSKVKKDSIGDSVGGLQLGDEVVKWNGKLLRGLTFDEVYSFISKSRPDNQQVELIVERLIDDSDRIKIKNSLWNNESANNADLKIPQQHQLEQELFSNSKIDSNKSIGKIQV